MSESSGTHAGRPTIEKHKADREIHIPPGHEPGEEFTVPQRIFYFIWWWICWIIGKGWFRITITGQENVPTRGAFIVSPIHRSNLDTPVMALVTKRRVRFMGKESLWKSRFGAWYFTNLGGFPVDRGTADRGAIKATLAVIDRGEPVVMFPEGTRQFGPKVCEMFDGPAYIASRAQIPIVPVGLGGTERALGKGARFPRPTKITMVIGQPIMPEPPNESGRVPRREVRELTERLGDAIQELFDEAQRQAGTPNA